METTETQNSQTEVSCLRLARSRAALKRALQAAEREATELRLSLSSLAALGKSELSRASDQAKMSVLRSISEPIVQLLSLSPIGSAHWKALTKLIEAGEMELIAPETGDAVRGAQHEVLESSGGDTVLTLHRPGLSYKGLCLKAALVSC